MRARLLLLMAAGIVAAPNVAAARDRTRETPAAPRYRPQPDYPAACRSTHEAAAGPQRVTVVYGVSKAGLAENVRVRESTNPCFDEAAIAAVRAWTFQPSHIDGRAVPQENLESTFVFMIDETAQEQNYDARPLVQVPPEYPADCCRTAGRHETVQIEFDITPEGNTENIRVVDSTHPCFNNAAKESVREWRYRPMIEGGVKVAKKSVPLTISFDLTKNRTPPEQRVRLALEKQFKRIQKSLENGADVSALLVDFSNIETRYGDSFSRPELAAFHQLRGGARLMANDYRGALDDLRAALRLGWAGESALAIGRTIENLEAFVAAQDAAAQAGAGASQQ